jgi:hypothetical protein
METSNNEVQISADPRDTSTKPDLTNHVIYGVLLACIIPPALSIPITTAIFQIRLAKHNLRQGENPKKQWRSAILTMFLVFAIMVIVVIFALM